MVSTSPTNPVQELSTSASLSKDLRQTEVRNGDRPGVFDFDLDWPGGAWSAYGGPTPLMFTPEIQCLLCFRAPIAFFELGSGKGNAAQMGACHEYGRVA